MLGQVSTASAKNLADRGRGQVADLGNEIASADQGKNFVGTAQKPTLESVDKERLTFIETADHEMAGDADWIEPKATAIAHKDIKDGEGDRNSFSALDYLVDETVSGVAIVLGISDVPEFVKEHAVDNPAFLADRHGLNDQLQAAGGHGVEMGAALADGKLRIERPAHEKHAGFELIVHRANESTELGDRIGEFQLRQIPMGVVAIDPILPATDSLQKADPILPHGLEFSQQRLPDSRRGVVEQIYESCLMGAGHFVTVHTSNQKLRIPRRNP